MVTCCKRDQTSRVRASPSTSQTNVASVPSLTRSRSGEATIRTLDGGATQSSTYDHHHHHHRHHNLQCDYFSSANTTGNQYIAINFNISFNVLFVFIFH